MMQYRNSMLLWQITVPMIVYMSCVSSLSCLDFSRVVLKISPLINQSMDHQCVQGRAGQIKPNRSRSRWIKPNQEQISASRCIQMTQTQAPFCPTRSPVHISANIDRTIMQNDSETEQLLRQEDEKAERSQEHHA
jgi:hypothetical protein